MELPDIWLTNGNPWELKRPGIKYPVGFYGSVVGGKWEPEEKVRVPLIINARPPAAPLPPCPMRPGSPSAGSLWPRNGTLTNFVQKGSLWPGMAARSWSFAAVI